LMVRDCAAAAIADGVSGKAKLRTS
jgi:hypothetical protein